MTWVRIDDNFPEHPKVDALSDAAFRMHVAGLCYANRHLTDGLIPDRMPRRFIHGDNVSGAVDELVDSGLWKTVPGGWMVHDYLEYQPSRAEAEARKVANRERQRAYRSRNGVTNGVTNNVTNGVSNRKVRDGMVTELENHPIPDNAVTDGVSNSVTIHSPCEHGEARGEWACAFCRKQMKRGIA